MAAEDSAPPPTSAVLMAISKHIAIQCGKENQDFVGCKRRDANPENCLKEGEKVTRCVIDLCALLSISVHTCKPQLFRSGVLASLLLCQDFDLKTDSTQARRLKDVSGKHSGELKSFYECLDYYRSVLCMKQALCAGFT